jgi:hypothetical protein
VARGPGRPDRGMPGASTLADEVVGVPPPETFPAGGLFRLEKNRIVVTGAGPAGQRYRMRLSWQAHTECVLGMYEPNVIRALQEHLRVGDTCLDVGGTSAT